MSTSTLHRRLLEAFDELWNDFVDPAEPYYDADGTRWNAVGGAGISAAAVPFRNQQQLADIRSECRMLAVSNEFAINGHERLLTEPPNCCGSVSPLGQIASDSSRRAPTTSEPLRP